MVNPGSTGINPRLNAYHEWFVQNIRQSDGNNFIILWSAYNMYDCRADLHSTSKAKSNITKMSPFCLGVVYFCGITCAAALFVGVVPKSCFLQIVSVLVIETQCALQSVSTTLFNESADHDCVQGSDEIRDSLIKTVLDKMAANSNAQAFRCHSNKRVSVAWGRRSRRVMHDDDDDASYVFAVHWYLSKFEVDRLAEWFMTRTDAIQLA
eukprot:6486792-Amphidinium_carterae.4